MQRPKLSSSGRLGAREGLADHLVKALEKQIRTGKYKPGEKIPTEQQLIEQFGVSRSVIREAVASLKSEGLLHAKQGIGVFVSSPLPARPFTLRFRDFLSAEELLQAQELRKSVEIEAAGLAAQRGSHEQIQAIEEACDRLERACAESGTSSSIEDFSVHLAIAQATNNHYYAQFLTYLRDQIMQSLNLKYQYSFKNADSTYRAEALAEHRALLNAIRNKDADRARDLMRAHLSSTLAHYQSLQSPSP